MRILSEHLHWLIWLLYGACLLALFRDGLIASEVPAFRDAYHFYFPQIEWLRSLAKEGIWFPRWNRFEGLGTSAPAQASAQLYYPFRLCWHLPALNAAQSLSLMVIVHLLLAAIGINLACKHLGLASPYRILPAVSYGLSCPVLFQHTNLIYLCSAAWIGFCLAGLIDLLRLSMTARGTLNRAHHASQDRERRSSLVQQLPTSRWVRSAACFVFGETMMVLGGDLHTAVNGCMIASLTLAGILTIRCYHCCSSGIVGTLVSRRSQPVDATTSNKQTDHAATTAQPLAARVVRKTTESLCCSFALAKNQKQQRATRFDERSRKCPLWQLLAWYVFCILSIICLTAVQWWPTWQWAQLSSRAAISEGTHLRPIQQLREHLLTFRNSDDESRANNGEREPAQDNSLPGSNGNANNDPPANSGNEASPSRIRHHRVYDFSLPPWHWLTVLWPTLFGHYFPFNSRWSDALSAEGRMWVPSVYFGTLSGLLVLHAATRLSLLIWRSTILRWYRLAKISVCQQAAAPAEPSTQQSDSIRGPFVTRRSVGMRAICTTWLVGVGLMSFAASSGNYSPIWMAKELLSNLGLDEWGARLPPDPVGTVYWLLTELVPGYGSFRYPAKWLPWMIAACVLLAGLELRLILSANLGLLWRLLGFMLGLSLIGLLVSISAMVVVLLSPATEGSWDSYLKESARDMWLGFPTSRSVLGTWVIAFGVPCVVLSIVWRWRKVIRRKNSGHAPSPLFPGRKTLLDSRRIQVFALGILTTCEMATVASRWTTHASAPRFDLQHASESADQELFVWSDWSEANIVSDILEAERAVSTDRPQRASVTSRAMGFPQTEFAELQTAYQQTWLLGKLGMESRVRKLSSIQSLTPEPLAWLINDLRRLDDLSRDQRELDRWLAALGVTHRLVRERGRSSIPSFTWQAITDTLPLCHLTQPNSNKRLSAGQVKGWKWTGVGTLEVELTCDQPCTLQVLQFNDNGWTVNSQPLSSSKPAYEPRIEEHPLLRIKLPAGAHQIKIQRH